MLLVLIGSAITSFVGSFVSFVIWVHFDFDERWEQRKYDKHKRQLERAERQPHFFDVPLAEQHQRERGRV